MNSKQKIVVIKIGSNVLTLASGKPNEDRIFDIVKQISHLKHLGYQVVLISSGAVAAGRTKVDVPEHLDVISKRQVFASVGQIALMNLYNQYFTAQDLTCSQVLITKESFSTRKHYLNITNCLDALLKCNIVPIINENDVISVTELMFTDNDELSGLVATMLNADELLILSNVDGIYTAHPKEPNARLIRDYFNDEIDLEKAVSIEKSEFGRGGMLTKANTAINISKLGVHVSIGNGNKKDILNTLLDRKDGTFFEASNHNESSVKKWIHNSGSFSKGHIFINDGAYQALIGKTACSLLPIGIEKITGTFSKGDIITIIAQNGKEIGYGKAAYSVKKAIPLIQQHDQPALIHYNYLTINE